MKKTLGGDRLGAGSRMQVDLHNFSRSTHNLGYVWRSTMAAGTLVPFMTEVALPGDTFEIDLEVDGKTHPTIGPLFGSYKIQIDTFLIPIRLYMSALHNNMLNVGMNMGQVKLPKMQLTANDSEAMIVGGVDIDNSQINPSSLLSYLNIRGVGYNSGTEVRQFNAIPFLAYWEIYKNYYANKMEEIGYVVGNADYTIGFISGVQINGIILPAPGGISLTTNSFMIYGTNIEDEPRAVAQMKNYLLVGENGQIYWWEEISENVTWDGAGSGSQVTVTIKKEYNGVKIVGYRVRAYGEMYLGEPELTKFSLSRIDRMRESILNTGAFNEFKVNDSMINTDCYGTMLAGETENRYRGNQQGLGIKTYNSDLFNNWLNTDWIDGVGGINEISAVSTVGDTFSIDTLNLAKKVYDMLNRIAVSGGSYNDWLDAVYVHNRYKQPESPMYMGGMMKELIFQEIVSNSATAEQPLGTLAGRGTVAKKQKGGKVRIKVDEPSYIMGIVSITPRLDYSQGNKWDTGLETMNDFHKPSLDEIGFQELITEQMAWWSTANLGAGWIQRSAGKQPAWINYMTNVNQVRGNFAFPDNEMFMTLNRKYELGKNGAIKDLTTYIDPAKFNGVFAETARDAQNFWMQIGVNMTARRKMSAKLIPNL